MKRIYDLRQNNELHLVCSSIEIGIEVEVASHRLDLLELDGYPVDTISARKLYLNPGETARGKFNAKM